METLTLRCEVSMEDDIFELLACCVLIVPPFVLLNLTTINLYT